MKKNCKKHGLIESPDIYPYLRTYRNGKTHFELRCRFCNREAEIKRGVRNHKKKINNDNTENNAEMNLKIPNISQELIDSRKAQINIETILINHKKETKQCHNHNHNLE